MTEESPGRTRVGEAESESSNGVTVTFRVSYAWLPEASWQSRLKRVVSFGFTSRVPEVVFPVEKFVPEQEAAFMEDQERVVVKP
jgi:hypothetical protein